MKDTEILGDFKDYIIEITEDREPLESGASLHCFHAVYDVAGARYRVEGSIGQECLYVFLEEETTNV